jgi:hypothetical protein
VDEQFARVDERFVRLEGEMREGFARVDERFEQVASKGEMGEMRAELRQLNQRFDRFLNAVAVSAVGFAGALLATLVGLLVL